MGRLAGFNYRARHGQLKCSVSGTRAGELARLCSATAMTPNVQVNGRVVLFRASQLNAGLG